MGELRSEGFDQFLGDMRHDGDLCHVTLNAEAPFLDEGGGTRAADYDAVAEWVPGTPHAKVIQKSCKGEEYVGNIPFVCTNATPVAPLNVNNSVNTENGKCASARNTCCSCLWTKESKRCRHRAADCCGGGSSSSNATVV